MTATLTLFVALVLDAIFGEPKWLWSRVPHPAVLMGRLIGWVDVKFNSGTKRKAKGSATLIGLVCLAGMIGWALSYIPFAEIVVGAILLAQKSLLQHVKAVASALNVSLEDGREAVAMIVGRDTAEMDAPAVVRAAIESAAENFSDGVIAPAFWFLIGGLPGILIYKMVNTADSMIGYLTPEHRDFGWASARFDDLLNLIPSRLTFLLLFPFGRNSFLNLRLAIEDAGKHRSPNAGWPEAALARALDLALSGPRAYHGELRDYPWVHPTGRKVAVSLDINAACFRLWLAWGTMMIGCLITIFGGSLLIL